MKKRLRKKKAKKLAQNYPFPWDRKWITKEEAMQMFPINNELNQYNLIRKAVYGCDPYDNKISNSVFHEGKVRVVSKE